MSARQTERTAKGTAIYHEAMRTAGAETTKLGRASRVLFRSDYRSRREMQTYLGTLVVLAMAFRFGVLPWLGDYWGYGLVAMFTVHWVGWELWRRYGRARFPLRDGVSGSSAAWRTHSIRGSEHKHLP